MKVGIGIANEKHSMFYVWGPSCSGRKKTVGGAKQALRKYRWQINFLIFKSKEWNPAIYILFIFSYLKSFPWSFQKLPCIPLSSHIKLQEGLSALFIVIAQSLAYNKLVNSMIAVTSVLNTFHPVPPYLAKSSYSSGFLVQRFSSFRTFQVLPFPYPRLQVKCLSRWSQAIWFFSWSQTLLDTYNHPLTWLNKRWSLYTYFVTAIQ